MSASAHVAQLYQHRKMVARVANRYLVAKKGLSVGQGVQNERVRVHRYADQLRVTDLTNAGKRGKKCPEMTVMLTYNYQGNKEEWFQRMSHAFLSQYFKSDDPYKRMKSFIRDIQTDFPDDIQIQESQLRGVDVEPYGQSYRFEIPMEDGKSTLRVEASPHDFTVVTHTWMSREGKGGFYQDTMYKPDKKKDAVLFYGWMKDNAPKVKTLKSVNDLRKIWDSLGVSYDYH